MPLQTGDRLGDYQIIDILGAGGMGRVYKVRNIISERVEAMKVLLPNLSSDPELGDRFMREIKVQGSLQHPNIASLHTAMRVENQLIMLMEFIEGQSLEKLLGNGPIPLTLAMEYTMQTLSALAYAHERGVVHRDIKPANIMVTPSGAVKLMDFGIARMAADRRLTQTGRTLGSLFYMSPEQINGVSLDARSDLYSLGISLYEMVTGRRPFNGDSDYSIMAAHLTANPVPPIQVDPRLPGALNDIILMSIAKDPGQRFQSAEAMRAALGSVLASMQAQGAMPTAPLHSPAMGNPAQPYQAPRGTNPHQSPMATPVHPMPAPAAAIPQAAPPRNTAGRGLYIALGSIVTVGLLVVAGTQAPRFFNSAGANSAQHEAIPAAPAESANPSPTPAAEQMSPSQTAAPAAQNAAQVAPSTTPLRPQQPASSTNTGYATPQATTTQPAPPGTQNTPTVVDNGPTTGSVVTQSRAGIDPKLNDEIAALREAKSVLMMLGNRAGTVKTSVDTIRQDQNRAGLNLRGDISTALRRMEFYLDEAEGAIRSGEVARAKSSLSSAEREIEKLENFLGH